MRTVVVTGSASGIGRALKELLEERGDRVIGVDIHDADIVVDLTTAEGRAALVEQVRELTDGRVDAVVANAGLSTPTPATVAVNYFGALATLDGLRPMLAGSAAPRAALTASMASFLPADDELVDLCLAGDEAAALDRATKLAEAEQGNLVYSSSKAAVCRWMRTQAPTAEWAGAGIPLNGIGPGIVVTPMTSDLTATEEATAGLLQMVPMPLNGIMAADVPAKLLAWLVGEENTHLCGQMIFIDGGSDAVIRGAATW